MFNLKSRTGTESTKPGCLTIEYDLLHWLTNPPQPDPESAAAGSVRRVSSDPRPVLESCKNRWWV